MQSPASLGFEPHPETGDGDVRASLREVLRSIDFAKDVGEAVRCVAAWAREELGPGETGIRVSLPDAAGRLRTVWSEPELLDGGRKRSARRRTTYVTGTPAMHDGPAGTSPFLVLPLVALANPLGVLEIVGPRESLQERWGSLELIARALGTSIYLRRDEEQKHRELIAVLHAITIARAVSGARSSGSALRAAARYLSARLDVPVAAWSAADDRTDLELVDVRGVGTRRRHELRATMRRLGRSEQWTSADRSNLVATFCHLADVRHAEIIDGGDTVIMIGSSRPLAVAPLGVVGPMLEEALGRRPASLPSGERRQSVGVAWAAHELRAPLLAVKAALEVVASAGGLEDRDLDLLGRSMTEIGQLAGLVEDILGWAGGGTLLRPTSVDLVSLVDDVVERSKLEGGEDRVVVHAPETAVASLDPTHMRTAIGNVLRNALAYADVGTKIEVTIEKGKGWVQVAFHDQGSPIDADSGPSIFEAFVRGHGDDRNRAGSGLGLFVAERVVTAHGGRIWFEPTRGGTTFFIRLEDDPSTVALT
jgi:signal transduction histidine kinase